jgi:hypothetical protein
MNRIVEIEACCDCVNVDFMKGNKPYCTKTMKHLDSSDYLYGIDESCPLPLAKS